MVGSFIANRKVKYEIHKLVTVGLSIAIQPFGAYILKPILPLYKFLVQLIENSKLVTLVSYSTVQ
jgi:hypothetical protein